MMKHWLYIIAVLIILCSCERSVVVSDEQKESFFKFFGGPNKDEGNDLVYLDDGGFILVGTVMTFDRGEDILIVRTDEYGNSVWTDTIGGTFDDRGEVIKKISDNEFVILGTTETLETENIFLVEISAEGEVNSEQRIETTSFDTGNDIILTQGGDYLIIGSTSTSKTDDSEKDILAIKLNKSKEVLWRRIKSFPGVMDIAEQVVEIEAGQYIMIGTTGYSFDKTNQKEMNVLVLELDDNGVFGSGATYGGLDNDYGKSLVLLSDGSLIAGGHSRSNGKGNYDFYVLKLNSKLKTIDWEPRWLGDQGNDLASSLYLDSEEAIYMVGYSDSYGETNDIFLLKIKNSTGERESQKNFGYIGNDEGSDIIKTEDGGIVIVGTSSYKVGGNGNNEGNHMITLIKTRL